jgi:hypothetical protein
MEAPIAVSAPPTASSAGMLAAIKAPRPALNTAAHSSTIQVERSDHSFVHSERSRPAAESL